MPGVTEEQIIAARRMTAIEFLRRYRPGELVKTDSRGEFELREHDSFKINEETSFWHWKSRDAGGKSALDYLIKVEGVKFVDAVLALCEENPCYIPPPSQPEQEKEFALPPASANNRRVFAYLLKRGISRKVIEACVRAGILYESADYHNAVFVGKDEAGTARYAFLRGTYTKSPSTASTTPSTIPSTRRNAPAGKTRNRWKGKSIRPSTKTKPSRICSHPLSAAPVKRLFKICAASRKCGTRKKVCRASIWCRALLPER